jgi:uncharacterized OB-fold protein
MSGPLRRIEPPVSDLTEPFWEATRRREFLIQWCTACGQPIFYPREVCPQCLTGELEWRPAGGAGTVHAVSVQHQGPGGPGPYAVALIDLDEGIRVMSNVIGCPPGEIAVGAPVRLTWEALSDGRHLPQFEVVMP